MLELIFHNPNVASRWREIMNTIDSSRLLAEMGRMASAANGGAAINANGINNAINSSGNEIGKNTISDVGQVSNQNSFGDLFSSAIGNVNNLQMTAGALSNRLVKGDPDVSIAETMIAGQKASVAFEATLRVRNKLVQAYQDIMNMPL